MSGSYFKDVVNFLDQHGVPRSDIPDIPEPEVLNFGVKHLNEELKELQKALSEEDLVDAADAIGDIIFVALNLAARMGLPMDEIWQAICKANSAPGKRKAQHESESKRGYIHDVIKTDAFVPPTTDIREALLAAWGHNESS